MPNRIALIAALVCALSGWLAVRHGRQMLRSGVSMEEGGGWTALLLTEFMISMAAACVAISYH